MTTFNYDFPGIDHLSRCKGKAKLIDGSARSAIICIDVAGTGAQNAPNFEYNLKKAYPELANRILVMFYPKLQSICNQDYCVIFDSGEMKPVTFQVAKDFIGCSDQDFEF